MKAVNHTNALKELISLTEKQKACEFRLLKEQFQLTKESLKPSHLIKSFIDDITASPEIKNNLLNNAIGLGTGILTKKLWVGSSHSQVKKIVGSVIEFAVANFVSKKSEGAIKVGRHLLKRFLASFKVPKEVKSKL